MGSYLGIDVGTTAVKVGLRTAVGTWIARSSLVPGAASAVARGEIDPEAWWVALRDALTGLRDEMSLSDVVAIALIGNTPTLVLVDAAGEPVGSALLWSDTRAQREADELRRERSPAAWIALYGGYLPVSAAYPSAKLRWLQRHRPQWLARTAQILQPKDFLNWRLTGVMAGDRWTSKGLVRLRPEDGGLSPLEAVGLPSGLAPPCYRPIDVIGQVTPRASAATGLPAGAAVAAGWSDTLGAVLSLGLSDTDGFVLSGTSESIGLLTRRGFPAASTVFCPPVWDSGYHILYGPTSAGLATVTWASEVLGLPLLDDAPAEIADAAHHPIFVPFLFGQRSPGWDDQVRGAWLNLDLQTTRAALGSAVLEGVVATERDVLEAAETVAGTRCRRIAVTGGGSHSAALNRWRAAYLPAPVFTVASEPVWGAAQLAYWAQHPATFPALGLGPPPMWTAVDPDPALQARYATYRNAQQAVLTYTAAQAGAGEEEGGRVHG